MPQRVTATYRGHVQGVGFRYTTRSVAHQYAVKGYVKNITSGHVALVAEGERAELQAFLDAVQQAMRGHISGSDIRWEEATGQFDAFDVRF